mmetsp:Transcript_14265/g.42970  ORF Transcript_14265/g.42970 Transcript_14265/m.42970 type:complete len:247 (-) Transcript_14265:152-892(-)
MDADLVVGAGTGAGAGGPDYVGYQGGVNGEEPSLESTEMAMGALPACMEIEENDRSSEQTALLRRKTAAGSLAQRQSSMALNIEALNDATVPLPWKAFVLGSSADDIANQLLGISGAATFLGGIALSLTTDPVTQDATLLQVALVVTVVFELVAAVVAALLRLFLFSTACRTYGRLATNGRYMNVKLLVFALFFVGVLAFFVVLAYVTFGRFSLGVGLFAVFLLLGTLFVVIAALYDLFTGKERFL